MRWKKEYNIGIPIIDTQHKQLFRFSDELQMAISSGLKQSNLKELLINVKQYVARHFTVEEKLMMDSNYPGLDEQLKAHAGFTNRFDEFFDDFQESGLTPELVNGMKKELIDWIGKHITGIDQKFGGFYKEYQARQDSADNRA
ncbi:MAG TPA: bacteriohemerythrin [Desulfobacterales bacterium]|nr:bacteriohemerythrin [Desulfobacterales bacterium]